MRLAAGRGGRGFFRTYSCPGGVFVTPPGWWHSHHNESDDVAWVLPMQDAGLYTHQACSIHWFPYDRVRVVNADP